ncbi:hypothetical protein KFU94_28885 [Chloroflexi bacterium TSY]|nr:hypothetical protein [Chloroflexi bacterium TSY]
MGPFKKYRFQFVLKLIIIFLIVEVWLNIALAVEQKRYPPGCWQNQYTHLPDVLEAFSWICP